MIKKGQCLSLTATLLQLFKGAIVSRFWWRKDKQKKVLNNADTHIDTLLRNKYLPVCSRALAQPFVFVRYVDGSYVRKRKFQVSHQTIRPNQTIWMFDEAEYSCVFLAQLIPPPNHCMQNWIKLGCWHNRTLWRVDKIRAGRRVQTTNEIPDCELTEDC